MKPWFFADDEPHFEYEIFNTHSVNLIKMWRGWIPNLKIEGDSNVAEFGGIEVMELPRAPQIKHVLVYDMPKIAFTTLPSFIEG